MNNPHIFRDFDKAIRALKSDVLQMASLSRQNLERAMRSLLERDPDLATSVIAEDSDVDELERTIDRIGMDILVRFHPVATDLRFVITSMKMAHNLERISDHAVNIAKRSRKISDSIALDEVTMTEPLYTLADQIFSDALRAYTDSDSALGEGLKPRDKELDRLHKEVIAALSKRLEEPTGQSESLLHLIFVARSIERIGDLAVNIGEDSVFLDSARDIRHEYRKAKESDTSSN